MVCPFIHISTKDAYANVKPAEATFGLKQIDTIEVSNLRNYYTNAFEATVFESYPELKEIKERLYEAGALFASMSGTGSSIFGVFKRKTSKNT